MKKDRSISTWFSLAFIEGCISLIILFLDTSESKNAFILNYSKARVCMILLNVSLLAILVLMKKKHKIFMLEFPTFFLSWSGALSVIGILIFAVSPIRMNTNHIGTLVSRAYPLLTWLFLLCIQTGYLSLHTAKNHREWFTGIRLALLFAAAAFIYYVLSWYYDALNYSLHLDNSLTLVTVPVTASLLWGFYYELSERNPQIYKKYCLFFGVLFFSVFTYSVIRSTQLWMGRCNTPSKAYWNLLADAFIHGKLYLENPQGTHDLTFYNGLWYVPNPPLPALLLTPYVLIHGNADSVNMPIYAAIISAINAGLTFLMTQIAFIKKMFKASIQTGIWITLLFVFGTDHFWLSTTGQMWFISQTLTVTFTILACISAIQNKSGFLTGSMLGLAILSRPNVFPIFFCILGIYLWNHRSFPEINIRDTFIWCLKAGTPVLLSVFILLLYNHLRFDNWLDFGYVTINGADWILDSVQKYGMFHPHFFRTNLDIMLFRLPRFDFSGTRYFFYPYVAGYSIFFMTPALIYIFPNFRKNWWIIGSWVSVIFTVLLLLFYHNTGAEQVGYRYILDASAPIILLLTNGTRDDSDSFLKSSTLFSIVLSFISIYWWYIGRS